MRVQYKSRRLLRDVEMKFVQLNVASPHQDNRPSPARDWLRSRPGQPKHAAQQRQPMADRQNSYRERGSMRKHSLALALILATAFGTHAQDVASATVTATKATGHATAKSVEIAGQSTKNAVKGTAKGARRATRQTAHGVKKRVKGTARAIKTNGSNPQSTRN